ncbi:hypothetical protein WDU94_010184 [Cyamophila willieti]
MKNYCMLLLVLALTFFSAVFAIPTHPSAGVAPKGDAADLPPARLVRSADPGPSKGKGGGGGGYSKGGGGGGYSKGGYKG